MTIKQKIVEKNKQYMLKFPKDTPTEKQAEYLTKLEEKLKTDRFVTIDSKIDVFPTKESHTIEEEVKDVHKDKPTKKDESTKAEPKKEDVKVTDIPTAETKEDTSGVTVDKIEVPAAKDAPEKTIFDENGSSQED